MARFFGAVGYAIPTETQPGVWEDVIVEHEYYGDVLRSSRRLEGEAVNQKLIVSNSISIVAADKFAQENFFAIQYVMWMGRPWSVTEVDNSQPPRLVLRLGEVYNGLTA
jgi:hypothetical protein